MISADVPPTTETAARFRRFGMVEASQRCPLYAALALHIAEDAELLALAARHQPGQPPANMLFGAARYLLRELPDHPLAAPFRTGRFEDEPYPGFRGFCLDHAAQITALLQTRRTQTNEVARCALWLPALAQVCGRAERPVALVEIGASAGLNLQFDRYHYNFGDMQVGANNSPVRLSCTPRGAPLPHIDMPSVSYRHGIDLNPIDPRNMDDQHWLLALIWPGQFEREERLRAALRLAREESYTVECADALRRLPKLLAELSGDHVVCVLHSFVLYQFTVAQRAVLDSVLSDGSQAGPVVRIGIETNKAGDASIKRYNYGSGGTALQVLGTADPHGSWLNWAG